MLVGSQRMGNFISEVVRKFNFLRSQFQVYCKNVSFQEYILSKSRRTWVRITKKAWMFVKCIVPLRHEVTLNSRRNESPLVRLVEDEDRWEAPDHP
ncbi:hypothetical protein TNCV_2425161 [Trichonephila clavipes]|nr:hypothetical protein TNCV_2425161 [Trichonephila clavipes]